jgi:hypothetical protein
MMMMKHSSCQPCVTPNRLLTEINKCLSMGALFRTFTENFSFYKFSRTKSPRQNFLPCAHYIYLLISPKYNQQDATFSRSIYFSKLLYMFHAVSPPIIRSTKLRTASGIVKPIQAAVLVWQYLALYIQFCASDDGRRNRMNHVEQFIEINRSRKRCILLAVLWRY